ncbi:hypothetical protein HDU96_002028, partial [Phlyctochytrium bullatum]
MALAIAAEPPTKADSVPSVSAVEAEVPRLPLNVIIPIGGVGSRFKKEGFRFPKPLINIEGRPMLFWIIDRLKLQENDVIWIAIREDMEKDFDFKRTMKKEYPNVDIRILVLLFDTRGAAETLYIVTQYMQKELLGRRTISLDCDTIYFCDILSMVRRLPRDVSATVYFHDEGSKP